MSSNAVALVAVLVLAAAPGGSAAPALGVALTPTAVDRASLTITITADISPPPSPLNVVFVIDRSSSIDAEGLTAAREAVRRAFAGLGPGDVGAIVAYGPTVDVLVDAQLISAGPSLSITTELPSLAPRCESALFGGISKGVAELRKHPGGNRVDRVLLVSDGIANIGPASADELEALGRSLAVDGIAVSTFGLGVGRTGLMARLAAASHGNHYRIDAIEGLDAALSTELGMLRRVGVRRADVRVDFAEGVTPIEVQGGDGEIVGPSVEVLLGAITRDRPATVRIELAIAPGAGTPLAAVRTVVDDVVGGRLELRAEVER